MTQDVMAVLNDIPAMSDDVDFDALLSEFKKKETTDERKLEIRKQCKSIFDASMPQINRLLNAHERSYMIFKFTKKLRRNIERSQRTLWPEVHGKPNIGLGEFLCFLQSKINKDAQERGEAVEKSQE